MSYWVSMYSYMFVMVKFIVWRTKAGRRTGLWWMYRLKSGSTEGIRGLLHCKFIGQTEKKTYTHDTNSCKQANRKGRCVKETKTITKSVNMLFFRFFVTRHERATAWLFHVGARQNYCVSRLSSRKSDGGLTMQVSCFKNKPNKSAGAEGDTPEVIGRHRSIIRIYYLCTVNVKHTLSCTRPNRVAAKGVGVPHSGVVAEDSDWGRSSNSLCCLH